jgi:hypothetical protein
MVLAVAREKGETMSAKLPYDNRSGRFSKRRIDFAAIHFPQTGEFIQSCAADDSEIQRHRHSPSA